MRAAGYVRVSSEDQATTGHSIDGQVRAVNDWAKANGADLELFDDRGWSRDPWQDRPRLADLLARLDEFDIVVFTRQDRFAVGEGWMALDRILTEAKLEIVSIEEPHVGKGDAMSQTMGNVNAVFGRHELLVKSERVRAGLRASAAKGRYAHGSEVYGYRHDPEWMIGADGEPRRGPVVIVPEEAEIIRRIDALYLTGVGIPAIAKRLNDEGLRRRNGGLWNGFQIRGILSRALYAGLIEYGKTTRLGPKGPKRDVDPDDWVEAECTTHPRIRDRETHDAIREMRARRSTHGRRAGSRGVFTGVLRCGGCGGPMSVKSWPTKSGETFVYRCTRNVKQGKAACDAPVSARETTLMEALVAELNAIRAGTVQPEVRLGDDRRPALERQLAKVERRLDLAISNLDDPEMRERFTKQDLLERLDYARSELERIQAEIDGLGSDPEQAGAALVKAFGIFDVLESPRSDEYVWLEPTGEGVDVNALTARAEPALVIEVGQEELARWESEGGDLVITEDNPRQLMTWEVDRDQWRAAVAQHVNSITATGPDTFAVVWC